jgi:hypothetical protein
MLIDVKRDGDVVTLKMSSGEELIGTYKEDDIRPKITLSESITEPDGHYIYAYV